MEPLVYQTSAGAAPFESPGEEQKGKPWKQRVSGRSGAAALVDLRSAPAATSASPCATTSATAGAWAGARVDPPAVG